MKSGIETLFQILEDGMIVFRRRMYMPEDKALKNKVIWKAHESRLTTHPGSTKMYLDLKSFTGGQI